MARNNPRENILNSNHCRGLGSRMSKVGKFHYRLVHNSRLWGAAPSDAKHSPVRRKRLPAIVISHQVGNFTFVRTHLATEPYCRLVGRLGKTAGLTAVTVFSQQWLSKELCLLLPHLLRHFNDCWQIEPYSRFQPRRERGGDHVLWWTSRAS